ncbi:Phosphorylated CTD-interacting factor 1 [Hondaea fermentalgiana]|uniref:Phosphorylated CTD-interacting factor 1 n=1 Tax=Hondaea fermentalgiana TaxID=2315210 RepID=A0A2R5FYX9_9STRA|nr:Phosphorylated CTD-interacting factor 1 [Hondaea fermentalgiana]|eukprot:GBG23957.1 Phosphorylated CTD-interacting factor 1 [Hondaea fermentalgiana]
MSENVNMIAREDMELEDDDPELEQALAESLRLNQEEMFGLEHALAASRQSTQDEAPDLAGEWKQNTDSTPPQRWIQPCKRQVKELYAPLQNGCSIVETSSSGVRMELNREFKAYPHADVFSEAQDKPGLRLLNRTKGIIVVTWGKFGRVRGFAGETIFVPAEFLKSERAPVLSISKLYPTSFSEVAFMKVHTAAYMDGGAYSISVHRPKTRENAGLWRKLSVNRKADAVCSSQNAAARIEAANMLDLLNVPGDQQQEQDLLDGDLQAFHDTEMLTLGHMGSNRDSNALTTPEPDREVATLLAIREMAAHFKATAGLWLRGRIQGHFEGWLWRRREQAGARTVLFQVPQILGPEEETCRKLTLAGAQDTKQISLTLDAKMNQLCANVAGARRTSHKENGDDLFRRHDEQPSLGELPRGVVSREDLSPLMCSFRFMSPNKTPIAAIPLIKSYYEGRLRDLWRNANQGVDETAKPNAYDEAVFCLLCRYLALQGGELKGAGGNQCAVLDPVLTVLQRDFGVIGECFGSPLNTRLPWFCSMFPDLDCHFGSQGDFFDFDFVRGSFEANPPYSPAIVIRMYDHMHVALERAAEANEILQFFVVIPHWPSRAQVLAPEAYARLEESPFKTGDIILRRSRHAFREGGQHYKGDSEVRVSSDASTVFVLQTTAASKMYPFTAARRTALERAFEPQAQKQAQSQYQQVRRRQDNSGRGPGRSLR